MTTVVSSTIISVRWDGLDPCRHVNGHIVLYRVRYTEVDSGVVQSIDEAGEWDIMDAETSLTGLTPFTSYSIQIAAVNEEGDVGLYSDHVIRQTEEDSESVIRIEILPPLHDETNSTFSSHIYSSWLSDHHTISLLLQNIHHMEPTRET